MNYTNDARVKMPETANRQPQVSEQISSQSVLLDQMEKQICALREKLANVTYARPTPAAPPLDREEPSLCTVAHQIRCFNHRISGFIDLLNCITNDIEA